MNESWDNHLKSVLSQLEQQQLLRQRGVISETVASDSTWLDFGNNDYLGLSRSSKVIQAIQNCTHPSWGSGASPVLSGYGDAHRRLEASLAKLCGTESALVFSSGFACNVGTLAALADDNCIVFSDQLNHASLIDGLRLSRASREVYPHNDLTALRKMLNTHRASRTRALIVTESVFSMDGDEAPLLDLAELAEQFDCGLVVDEAHAVGVFGNHGGGLLEELGMADRVLLKLGTLSKAMGGIGGYAAGNRSLIEYLVNRCRSYLFSTACPALAAIAAQAAIEQLTEMRAERQQLAHLSSYTRLRLKQLGWTLIEGRSPIVPIIIGSAERTLQLSQQLRLQQIYVPAIRPPTVPANTCRLRVSLSAYHTQNDIDRLISALGQQ